MGHVRAACAALLSIAVASVAAAQTTVTLDATSGTGTIATNYSTTGGLTLDMGFFVDYLIVGGGGGGGSNHGGGGGAGGFTSNLGGSLLQITSTNSTITVGGGGVGGTAGVSTAAGGDGGGSSAFGISVAGGGGGGSRADQGSPTSFYVGRNGASGGGGGGIGTTPAGGTGIPGQGSNGGSGIGGGAEASGGGGGGAGATGANSSAGVAGNGGAGLSSTITGSSRFYAGGGGGGTGGTSTTGTGGSGIGGNGNNGGTGQAGSAGATNTGSGGGGGGGQYGAGGAGAAGIVVVRYAGTAAGTGGSVTSGSGSAAGTTLHTFTGSGTLAIPLATRLAATLSGSLTGSGTFTYNGPGTLTLAGVNTSTGPTAINGGTLVTTATGLLPSAATVTIGSGGALQLGANQTVGGLAGAGAVILGNRTLTTAGGGQTFSGGASGAGGITKTGTGIATFTGQNTFTGQLAVVEGTLALGTWNDTNTAGPAGNSSLPIQLGSGSTAGTLSYGGPSLGTTNTGLNKGLSIASGGGAVVITATGGRGSYVHVSGSAITGDGTFTVSAPQARFIVVGSASNTGSTVVQSGELQGNVHQLTQSTPFGAGANGLGSAVTVNSGAVLTVYTGDNTGITRTVLLGSLTGSGTVRGEAAGPLQLLIGGDGSSTTFAGTITDSFNVPITGKTSLTKTGTGTLTLSGSSDYTGATTVSAGKLTINGNQAAATGPLTVAAGAALGGSGTIGGITTIAGLHSPGNSPGVQTFTGDLVYSAGASVLWELTANTAVNSPVVFDQIVVGGNLAFDAATSLSLSFDSLGSLVDWNDQFWASDRSWTLYDVAGSTGSFSNLSISWLDWRDGFDQLLSASRPHASFSLEQQGSDVVLTYAAVPEPSGLALVACGGTLLAVVRRIRRRG